MLSNDDLSASLAAIPVLAPVRADEVTGSTNATAIEMAEAGTPEWTLVSAAHQTEGRGRLGRAWTDVPDKALYWLPPASPGGETAWKHSNSPMPRKPTATIRAFRSDCSRLEASSTKAIAMAANQPRASTEE